MRKSSLPLRGGWHPASHASRMTEEVIFVPLLHPSKRAARKIHPLEGRVASGVSRKPVDGRGVIRSAFAFVGANCDSVRHLFRRLRRHLPLEGKDFVFRFVREKKPGRACFLVGFVLKYL